ncbi:chromosome partitioning protein [Gammaproteobacteria bacterium]
MNLELPDLRATPEVIAIVGTLDGAGKTTTSMNLAVAFAASGRTVLLIDLDPGGAIGNSLIRGWHGEGGSSRLFTEAVVTRDMIAATEIPDLYLLPAEDNLNAIEYRLASEGDSRTRLVQSLETLRALPIRFDLVIANCPSDLGLITLNALSAAHWVLIPVPTTIDAVSSASGVPALLTTIQRLRGGMRQPLRGVYLLPTQETDAGNALVTALHSGYGPMALPLAIPWSEKVDEADQHSKPVLVYAPHDPISVAYLELAAEWLKLINRGTQTSTSQSQLLFPAYEGENKGEVQRQKEESAQLRLAMEKRIHAWLVDPSCLLYDATEARSQPEPKVLEELIELTTRQAPLESPTQYGGTFVSIPPVNYPGNRSMAQEAWTRHRVLISGVCGFLLPIFLLLIAPVTFRFELAAWLISPAQYWNSASTLLFRADETAYRELILGTKLVGNNRSQLFACEEEAQAKGAVVTCSVAISPE